jgi:hypothetical protein
MAKKAKRATAKRADRAPSKKTQTPNVPLTTVVAFVQWLEEQGHTKDFLAALGKQKVTLSALSFQRVRSFVGQKQPGAAEAAGKSVGTIPACPPGTYRCF